MKKMLPKGNFIRFEQLPLETSEEDLQAVIAERTGVSIPLERITVNYLRAEGRAVAMISMEKVYTVDLLNWALSEDSLYGKPIVASVRRSEE